MTDPDAQASLQSAAATQLRSCGFFLLRTPLLPLDELWGRSSVQDSAPQVQSQCNEAMQSSLPACRAWMQQQLSNPVVREALLLASSSLASSIEVWVRSPESERGQKVERALFRYLSRMVTRPTPFGLFAGCSYGTVGPRTHLKLDSTTTYRRHTQLDQEHIEALITKLLASPDVAQSLHYHTNGTLFVGAGRWRYVESRTPKAGQTSFHLVAVERSNYLDEILRQATAGASHAALTAAVQQCMPTASQEQAAGFIEELVRCELLYPEVRSLATGADPLEALARQLRSRAQNESAALVEKLFAQLALLDAQGLGQSAHAYVPLQQELPMSSDPPNLSRLVHVDLWKPAAAATLAESVVAEAARGVALLARLQRPREPRALKKFKQAFLARYEDKQVPLLHALDPECGIGFDEQQGMGDEAAVLLSGLKLGTQEPAEPQSFSPQDALLLQLVVKALQRGATQLQLSEEDLATLPPAEPAPAAVSVLGALLLDPQPQHERPATQSWLLRLDAALGPSATSLLGRFCHCDPELQRQVVALAAAEQALRPDVILAEVAHMPPGRAGNIVRRPELRQYEIPLLGPSSAASERQLELSDLWLSVTQDRLVLSSKRLGKQVLPRLANAHNFAHPRNVALYRFLCHIQEQESPASLAFNWGPLAGLEHLPRVVSGQLILAPAQWRLPKDALLPLFAARDWALRKSLLQSLQAARKLPRFVTFAEADNVLLVDLESPLSVEAFLDAAKSRAYITLVEFLFAQLHSPVTGPEGTFANEVVIPLCRKATPENPGPRQVAAQMKGAGPNFGPGSEWLFLKLYTGMATIDPVLTKTIRPLVSALLQEGLINRWYFVRYRDPDCHLRLRLCGDPQQLCAVVLPRLAAALSPLLETGQVRRMQLDTYEPEYDRYGGEAGLKLSEEIFFQDSQVVLQILNRLVGDASAQLRWQTTLASMATLLRDLFPDVSQRLQVVEAAQRGFFAEHAVDSKTARQIGARFRVERPALDALMDAVETQASGPLMDVLIHRSEHLKSTILQLQCCAVDGVLTAPLTTIAESYLHMIANRLFRSAARAQEALLYDFLCRLYVSRKVRSRTVLATA